jgi:hypothetical protein
MKTRLHSLFIVLGLLAGIDQAAAQGTTAFTYQGQLRDGGTNANGTYTMIFKLYDSVSGGSQIATALTNSAALANGFFSVNLDFGAGAFDGTARWLDITVTNRGTTQTLSPRVQVLPAPYALFSAVAATVATNTVATINLQDGAVTDSKISTTTTLARTVAETNLVIIRGSVNSNGTVVLGQGFTCVANTSTNRIVTFNTPFSGIPSIALGQHGTTGGGTVDLVTSSTSGFEVVTLVGGNGPSGFEFIAIGPK